MLLLVQQHGEIGIEWVEAQLVTAQAAQLSQQMASAELSPK
jgi:hypothetical protein